MRSEIALPMGLKLSPDLAVYCREDDLLAITDLHIGYEASLQTQHVAIPRFQMEEMAARLSSLIDKYNPENILINGDMKHEFGRNIGQEWDEVEHVIDILQGQGNVVVVRGNHDNYLQTILSKRGVQLVEMHVTQSGLVFTHGHKPSGGGVFTVYGHEHPVMRLRDDVGATVTMPCFLYDEENEFLILPAFSPLASGTNVLSPVESYLIEELRSKDVSNAIVYAISETEILDFGRLRDLDKARDAYFMQQ